MDLPGQSQISDGGIELAEKIKKGQFKLGGRRATLPEIWRATLAA